MPHSEKLHSRFVVLIVLLAASIFVIDLYLPPGISGGVLYVAVVLVSLSAPGYRFTQGVALFCSFLTVAGYMLSPASNNRVVDTSNSLLALFAIWVTAVLSLQRKKAEQARARMEQFASARERLAMLGELAAGIAHEFRNPLDGVLNCVQLLRPKIVGDPSDLELADMAEEGLRRMDTISKRMLRLGREENGQRLPTAVKEVVDSAVSLIAIRAQKEGVTLEVSLEPDLAQVDMDAERVSEALLNLLTNALDACKPGCKVIVKGANHPDARDTVVLSVFDNGSGIPAEVRSKIFEPFFTTKAVGKGSGLGLAISRKIAEIHGGTLQVSEAREGTTFSIVLPCKAGPHSILTGAKT